MTITSTGTRKNSAVASVHYLHVPPCTSRTAQYEAAKVGGGVPVEPRWEFVQARASPGSVKTSPWSFGVL